MAYNESDPANPLSAYGHSKLCGEMEIQASDCKHVILRTSWLYGQHGKNFAKTILKLAHERDSLNIIDDQISTPTSAEWLANSSKQILEHFCQDGENSKLYGLFNCTPDGQTSWFGFAQYLIQNLQLETKLKPISTDEYPTVAQRPRYSVLSNEKFQRAYNIEHGPWQKYATQYCDEYK